MGKSKQGDKVGDAGDRTIEEESSTSPKRSSSSEVSPSPRKSRGHHHRRQDSSELLKNILGATDVSTARSAVPSDLVDELESRQGGSRRLRSLIGDDNEMEYLVQHLSAEDWLDGFYLLFTLAKFQQDEVMQNKVIQVCMKTITAKHRQEIEEAAKVQYQTVDVRVQDNNRSTEPSNSYSDQFSEHCSSIECPMTGHYPSSDGSMGVVAQGLFGMIGSNHVGFVKASRIIPLRLFYSEREFLRLLESTLHVSEYTDVVDRPVMVSAKNKAQLIAQQFRQLCSVLSALVLARSYDDGQKLLKDRDFSQNEKFFRTVFEIGRRYKILNPDRMRDAYGQLMYFLMDTQRSEVKGLLKLGVADEPIRTVFSFLENKKNGIALLQDPLLRLASAEIIASDKRDSQTAKDKKSKALQLLISKYSTRDAGEGSNRSFKRSMMSFYRGFANRSEDQTDAADPFNASSGRWDDSALTEDDVEHVVYSISDYATFLTQSAKPCEDMIAYLKSSFNAISADDKYSLAIISRVNGARLTHDHARQFMFVQQSLELWREILENFYLLWLQCDHDLLSEGNNYRLCDTGQGFHRLQAAPHVGFEMRRIIQRVHARLNVWVGSQMVHLGDHNVPNAFWLIDKYTQVPRILSPLLTVLNRVPVMCHEDPKIKAYVCSLYGSPQDAVKAILCDFFKHAFDGSGADNFFDAGSCIDGRLTSAWNWCSKVDSKEYYPLFLLCGFAGFDGKF